MFKKWILVNFASIFVNFVQFCDIMPEKFKLFKSDKSEGEDTEEDKEKENGEEDADNSWVTGLWWWEMKISGGGFSKLLLSITTQNLIVWSYDLCTWL